MEKKNTINITIRRMEIEDATPMHEIERECFSQPWTQDALVQCCKDENYLILVAAHENRVVGYVGCTVSNTEADITNVAVTKNYRRRKIAQTLMRKLLELLSEMGVTEVFLEVRITNEAAHCLYRSMGYEEVGVRKNFYRYPTEDALIMKWTSQSEI